jgi:broad specificity phosphatase PhoE
MTFKDLSARWPAVARRLLTGDTQIDWPGGESATSLHKRVEDACSELATASSAPAIVVSHAWPIAIVLATAGVDAGPGPIPTAGAIAIDLSLTPAITWSWRPPR